MLKWLIDLNLFSIFSRELLFECSDQDKSAVHEPVMLMKIVSAQLLANEGIQRLYG